MQGRLLPKFQGRFQAHPIGYWHDEFQLAANLGFDCIEFILDFDQVLENPLLVESGLTQIQKLTADTGVRVLSVCADYFMVAPLHSVETDIAHSSLKVLNKLYGLLNVVMQHPVLGYFGNICSEARNECL